MTPFQQNDPREMTYYELLEVSPEASADEVRAAVPAVRRKWSGRQSRVGEPGERARAAMARIAEAESILLDPARRAAYDESLRPRPEAAAAPTRDGDRDWLAEAQHYLDQGNLDLAEGALDHAMVKGRDKADTWLVAFWVYRARSTCFAEADRAHIEYARRADKALREALLLEPENYVCHETQGDALDGEVQSEEAYKRAQQLALQVGDSVAAERLRQKILSCRLAHLYNSNCDQIAASINSMAWHDNEVAYNRGFDEIDASIASLRSRLEKIYAEASQPMPFLENMGNQVFALCDNLARASRQERRNRIYALRQKIAQEQAEKKAQEEADRLQRETKERQARIARQNLIIWVVGAVAGWFFVYFEAMHLLATGNNGPLGTLIAFGSAIAAIAALGILSGVLNRRGGSPNTLSGLTGCLLPIAYFMAIMVAQLVYIS